MKIESSGGFGVNCCNRVQYRPSEVAELLGVSLSKVKAWISNRTLHSYKIDGMRFVAPEDVIAFRDSSRCSELVCEEAE